MERIRSAKDDGTRTGEKGWICRAVGRLLGGSVVKCDSTDTGGKYESDDLIQQVFIWFKMQWEEGVI